MRILDRYILKTVFASYLCVLLVFVVFYLFIDASSNISDMIKAKAQMESIAGYYLNMLPLIFSTVSPFSLLIAVLFTFGDLNRNNEILTMRAAGINLKSISFPVVFMALLISVASLFLQEKFVVPSQRNIASMKLKMIKRDLAKSAESKNIAFTSSDTVFFARRFWPKELTMRDVIAFKEDNSGRIEKKLICKRMVYSGGGWLAEDVIEYKLDKSGAILGTPVHWNTKNILLDDNPEELARKKGMFARASSLKDLKKEMRRLSRVGAKRPLTSVSVDYYRKIGDPFSHLFLILGVLPLALRIKKRKAALSSLAVGFIFGFIYYSIGSFCFALGKEGVISPAVSAWAAPFIFTAFGAVRISSVR